MLVVLKMILNPGHLACSVQKMRQGCHIEFCINLFRWLKIRRVYSVAVLSVLLFTSGNSYSYPFSLTAPFDNPPINKSEVVDNLTFSTIVLRVNDGANRQWIADQARNERLATKGEWTLNWFSENLRKGVAAAIFQHQSDAIFTLAFKGQNMKNIDDMYHGLGIEWMDDWPYLRGEQCQLGKSFKAGKCPATFHPLMEGESVLTGGNTDLVELVDFDLQGTESVKRSSNGMKVSAGAKKYAEDLLQLEGVFNFSVPGRESTPSDPLGIIEVISYLLKHTSPTAEAPLTLNVTGDSLGGTAAVLVATYIYQWLKTLDIAAGSIRLRISITNAPGLYNREFVDFYNNMVNDSDLLVAQQFYRLNHDIVSNYYVFNLINMAEGIVNATDTLRSIVKAIIVSPVAEYLKLTGQEYAQVGDSGRGTITTIVNTASPEEFNIFGKIKTFRDLVHYYEFNHFTGSMFTSLGAPAVACPPGGCIGLEQ